MSLALDVSTTSALLPPDRPGAWLDNGYEPMLAMTGATTKTCNSRSSSAGSRR